MLRRLTVGFAVLSAAIAIAACSSNSNNTISVGPNFPSSSLYATNTSQNAISIYAANPANNAGPQYQIGGSTTDINGPQYLTFDSSGDLFVTNYNGSATPSILEFKALATGSVIPIGAGQAVQRPRGIAYFSQTVNSTATPFLAVGNVNIAAGPPFASQLMLFNANDVTTPNQIIAGPATGLNVPGGVAVDKNDNIYVANLQAASVEAFTAPTPAPTPSTTPSASPSATPTATPTVNPSAPPTPTPTPVPTSTPLNQPPSLVIAGPATGLTAPTSVAIDAGGNVYVTDQGNGAGVAASVMVFAPGLSGVQNVAPLRKITGSATGLFAPTDVKVDSTGQIYVADSTSAGAGIILIYAAGANGNTAPTKSLTSPGAVIGIGLTP